MPLPSRPQRCVFLRLRSFLQCRHRQTGQPPRRTQDRRGAWPAQHPDRAPPRYYLTLLSAIRSAETNIWISAAYFVPTHDEKEDLIAAARRGVDVSLLLPAQSDSDMAINVGHSHYSDLMEAGVRIYEVQNEILHSKTVAIDGVWLVIGSSNFDQRSVLFNDEVDAVVLGSATATSLQKMFEADQKLATPIDPATWARRPLSQKLKEAYSRVWESQL